jgi:hypothetical protein
MGKYATYRLRGGGQSLWPPLGPPPAPSLEIAEDELLQTSNTANNDDGLSSLYYSVDGLFNWTFQQSVAWSITISWGQTDNLDEGYYRVTETGNHIDYEGQSAPSNTIQVVHD